MELRECQTVMLVSVFGTFAFCFVVTSFIAALIFRSKRNRQQKSAKHIEGTGNDVFEDEWEVARKTRNGIGPNNHVNKVPSQRQLRLKSPSMPILPTSSNVEQPIDRKPLAYKEKETVSVATQCHDSQFNCTKISAGGSSTPQTVVVEKVSENNSVIEFTSAGVLVKEINVDEVLFLEGSIESGDQIISINGVSLNDENEARSTFNSCGRRAVFKIRKAKLQSSAENDANVSEKEREITTPTENQTKEDNKDENHMQHLKTETVASTPKTTTCNGWLPSNQRYPYRVIEMPNFSYKDTFHKRNISAENYKNTSGHCENQLSNRAQSEENIRTLLNSAVKCPTQNEVRTCVREYGEKDIHDLYEDLLRLHNKDKPSPSSVMVQRGYNNDYLVYASVAGLHRQSNGYNFRMPAQFRHPLHAYQSSNNHSSVYPANSSVHQTLMDGGYVLKDPPDYEQLCTNYNPREVIYDEQRFMRGKDPPPYQPRLQRSTSNVKSRLYGNGLAMNQEISEQSNNERRHQPKRAHSIHGTRKHLEHRCQITENIGRKNRKTHRKIEQGNTGFDRRKSIDSGTLQQLAREINNNPEIGEEYPMISHLLGESHLASQRKSEHLHRYKSTETLTRPPDIC